MKNVVNGLDIWKKYWFQNKFKMFDIGSFKNNDLIIHGRNDDVINIRGHRIGSEEIESVLVENEEIIEVSAVAVYDKIEGSKIIVFINTKKLTNQKIDLMNEKIKEKLSSHFGSLLYQKNTYLQLVCQKQEVEKFLRRLLRDLYKKPNEKELGDLSTMVNKDKLK